MPAEPRITRGEILRRIERTRRLAAERTLDALIVVGRSFYDRPGDLAYLTNHFPPFPASVFSGGQKGLGHGLLLLPVKTAPVLIIDGRSYRKELVAIDEVRADTDLPRALIAALRDRSLGTARVGLVGEDILPLVMYREVTRALPTLVIEPADDLVRLQRVVKSPAEQALLRRAAEVADAGLRAALSRVRDGVRENEVCATGIAAAVEAGADFVRYLRVHSGPNSASGSRWPQATPRVMERGELVAMDIIGAAEGYQFDVLRTTVVERTGPDRRRLLDAIARAVDAAVAAARPGVVCGDLVRLANGLLADAGFGAYTSGFMGHGIGLETVEDPYLTPEAATCLQPGMVVCIEPNARIPGRWGASIEQEVIITDGAPEVITPTPTHLW